MKAPTVHIIASVVLLAVLLVLSGCGAKQTEAPPRATIRASGPTANQQKETAAPAAAAPAPADTVKPTGAPTRTIAPTSTPTPEPTSLPVTPQPVRLTKLAWSPDGKLLAVGSATGVYLYDTATWQEVSFVAVDVSVPSSLEDGVDDLAFSLDGALLGTAGRQVQVWRVANGSLAYEIQASRQLAASPTEGLWVTTGDSHNPGNLRLWRLSDGQLAREISTGVQFVASIAFSPDGQLIAAGPMVDSSPAVWRTADGQRAGQLNWGQAEMFGWVDLAFRPNTSTAVAVGTDDVLLLWDTSSGGIRLLTGPNDMTKSSVVNRVSYAPDGNLFATSHSAGPGRQGGSVQLWSAEGSRGQVWQITAMPKDVAFGPDSKLLAATDEQMIYVWRLRDGELLKQVRPVWHHGILPTPTPTPLALGLNLPADWQEYYNLMAAAAKFKLRYPSTWMVSGEGTLSVTFRKAPGATGGSTVTQVEIMAGIACLGYPSAPGSQASVDWIKTHEALMSDAGVFVTGGKWPMLIPAGYAVFDSQGIPGKSSVREIMLYWWAEPNRCATATLELSAENMSEQDRSDISQMLASLEFVSGEHPLPTATVTNTPMPLALPLQIAYEPRVLPNVPAGVACPEFTIEVRDARGEPVHGAEIRLFNADGAMFDSGPIFYGQYGRPLCPQLVGDRFVAKISWNGQLVATQEIVISWHEASAAQPMKTSTPRAINKATDVPSPTARAVPTTRACAIRVTSDLADLYEQTRLGCPTSSAKVEWGAWETFERGALLWRSATDEVYAFTQQGGRSWLNIPDRWNGQEIKGRGKPPAGLQAPVRGFGFVWEERDDLFALLGWATDQERGFCFTLQPFEQGFLMRSKAVQSCTPDNLYNQATSPDWKPVSLAVFEGGWSDRRPAR